MDYYGEDNYDRNSQASAIPMLPKIPSVDIMNKKRSKELQNSRQNFNGISLR